MKKLFIVTLLLFSLFIITSPIKIEAAGLKNSARIKVSAYKTAKDVRATFSNLKSAKKISYELTYTRSGLRDGAGGTIIPKGKTVTKIVTLGTCSGKVCTFHKGVANIKLKVTTWYSPSLTVETKTYSIR